DERSRLGTVPLLGELALATRPVAAQPTRPGPLGPHGSPDRSLYSSGAHSSSISSVSSRRHHPRQEPDAVIPPVRIRGGGAPLKGHPYSDSGMSSKYQRAFRCGREHLARRFAGWLRLQPYTVHGDDGVGVLLAGLGRGVPVAHFRKRLVGRVVVRHRLEQWAAKLADWRPRQFRQFLTVAQHDKAGNAALKIGLGP